MKKNFHTIFILILIISFFCYCKSKKIDKNHPAITVEQSEIAPEEQEQSFTTRESPSQNEEIIKFESLLNDLNTNENIILAETATNNLKALYYKYDSESLNESLSSYIHTLQSINPKTKIYSEEDFNKYLKNSFVTPGQPRKWGKLIIHASPQVDIAWIRDFEMKDIDYDEKIEMNCSLHQVALLEGEYEVIVYYGDFIRGNRNVKVKSIKDDKDGKTLEYTFK